MTVAIPGRRGRAGQEIETRTAVDMRLIIGFSSGCYHDDAPAPGPTRERINWFSKIELKPDGIGVTPYDEDDDV